MLLNDLRFSVRILRKRPGTTFLVIAALVFGIGISTSVFSVVNAVLLRPVPVFEPERVVRIYALVNRTGATMGISYPEYLDWKAQTSSFDSMSVMRALSFYLSGTGRPEHLNSFSISASGFRVFGVSTVLGRGFTEAEDTPEADHTVILSHPFWERKFGSDPQVLGRSLSLDNESYTIIGVLQPTKINVLQYPDVWVPNGLFLDQRAMSREIRLYFPAARLKSTASPTEAQTEMATIAARLAAQYPSSNKDMGIRFVGLTDLLTARDRKPLSLLFVASVLIFTLACVNVVIVLVSWTADRRPELSIRMALGSPRSRILRQLLLQSLLLVGTGSLIGLAAAKLALIYFLRHFPSALVRFQETTIDYRVIGFLVVMMLVAALLATVVPGLYASRLSINSQLKGTRDGSPVSRYRSLRQAALITVEVSLASALLLVSGLLIKSFYEVASVDLGFSPHNTFSFQINLPSRYKVPDQASFYKRAIEGLSGIPGMSHSSAISSLPLTTQGNAIGLEVDSQSRAPAEQIIVENEAVLPSFFATMNLPILKGRDFTVEDRDTTPPVVIVDEVLAAKLWPGQVPLGKRIRLVEISGTQPPWREVVGVVRQIKHFGPEAKVRWMQVYVPEYQDPSPVMSFVINSTLPEADVKTAAEKAIQAVDRDLPIDNFEGMDDLLDDYLAGRKVSLLALSSLAAIAVVLAVIGIYGVVANSVVRRRREIAIRLALGAPRRKTVLMLIRMGLGGTLAGIVIGFALVASLTRLVASFLFGIKPLDLAVYVVSAGMIFLLAVVFTLTPARTVFRLNPNQILRE
jgi:putative ABC transport system permease protein